MGASAAGASGATAASGAASVCPRALIIALTCFTPMPYLFAGSTSVSSATVMPFASASFRAPFVSLKPDRSVESPASGWAGVSGAGSGALGAVPVAGAGA